MRLLIFVLAMLATGASFKANAENREEAVRCIAENIYHEARGENLAGQFAVAEVTRLRKLSPKFPNSFCGVVWQKRYVRRLGREIAQFSWTLDGRSDKITDQKAWQLAKSIAELAYEGVTEGVLPSSRTWYYHSKKVRPGWAKRLDHVASIGEHLFYAETL